VTGRPPRDLRDEAKQRLAALLRREQHPAPELFANELLVALDGIHIGLTDTTPPNPDTVLHPPGTGRPVSQLPPDNPYRAARAAMKGTQQ
jgi:hypothetical protein